MLPSIKNWSIFPPWNKQNIPTQFSDINRVFNLKGDIISKSNQSEIFTHCNNGKTFFVKRYFTTKGIGSWFGYSRLQLEVRNQLLFNQLNLPAAKIVIYGSELLFLKPKRGVLITEGIDNVKDLAAIANQQPGKFNDANWRAALFSQIAHILKKLHQNSFCHNDMHWRNILVKEDINTISPQVFLIDCPSGKYSFGPFLQYKILKDLANIDKHAPRYFSKTQRLKFFMAYRQVTRLSHQDKTMVTSILRHKSNRIKRKAKAHK